MDRAASILAGLALCAASGAQARGPLWYNGDWTDGLYSIACEMNSRIKLSLTYEDFRLGREPWLVDQVWGNFVTLFFPMPRSAYYEVRKDVLPGVPGVLVRAGTVAAKARRLGWIGSWHYDDLHLIADIPPLRLEANTTYWIAVAPVGIGEGRAFVMDTRGERRRQQNNPNPKPLGFERGISYLLFTLDRGYYYRPIDQVFDVPVGTCNYSYGVAGTVLDR